VAHPNQETLEGALEEAWVSRVVTLVSNVKTS